MPNIKKHKLLIFQVPFLFFFEFLAALKIIKSEKIELIHAHWLIPQGIVAYLLRMFFGLPYIITSHGSDVYGLNNSFLAKLKTTVLRHATLISVVSHDMKRQLTALDSDLPVVVAPMGVDSSLFSPQKTNPTIRQKYSINGPFLLYVGRLSQSKGVDYLLQSIQQLILSHPNLKLLVVGGGGEEKNLKELASSLHLDENVIFTGPLPNHSLPELYASADFFVGPSVQSGNSSEGLGLTFVEASFSGCIPIGTDVGGITDVIEHFQSGFIVKQKDPQSLTETIRFLLTNPNIVNEIKTKTRILTVNKFDWSVVAKSYLSLYNQCLSI